MPLAWEMTITRSPADSTVVPEGDDHMVFHGGGGYDQEALSDGQILQRDP